MRTSKMVPRWLEKKEETYLGSNINESSDRDQEVGNRLSKAIATCQRLQVFWAKTKTPL